MLIRLTPFGFVLLWSSSFIASRVGLRYLSPLYFVTVRMVAAAVVLVAVMVLLQRSWRPVAGRWGHLVVSGVLTNTVLLMTAHYAMVHTGAAPIALVQTLNPLLTALLAWPLLGEKLRPLQWLGSGAWRRRRGAGGGAGSGAQPGRAEWTAADRRRRGRAVQRHAVFRPVLPRGADAGGHHGATGSRRGGLRGGDAQCSRRLGRRGMARRSARWRGTRRRSRWAGWRFTT